MRQECVDEIGVSLRTWSYAMQETRKYGFSTRSISSRPRHEFSTGCLEAVSVGHSVGTSFRPNKRVMRPRSAPLAPNGSGTRSILC